MRQARQRRNACAAAGFARHAIVMLGSTRDMNRLARVFVACIALALSACTARPPEAPPETGDAVARYAPGTRAALDNEWKLFGDGKRGHVVDLRRVGPPEAPRWPGDLSPERRLCVYVRNTYWQLATGNVETSELTPPARRDAAQPPQCDNPWSAVFISAALRANGVQARDFRFDALHSAYLRDILHRYRAWQAAPGRRERPLLVPHPMEERAPQPGDLICASRRGEREAVLRAIFLPSGPRALASWDAALDEMEFGHCDFVVSVDARRRTLAAIGGNVQDTISRSLVPLDAGGLLIRTIERPWFIVIENRLP
jgi:hypothetical protein